MEKDKRLELAKLIEENPDMDIIAAVCGDDLYEDGMYMQRGIWKAAKQKWTDEVSDEHIYFDDEEDDIKEHYIDYICEDEDLTDAEYDKKADEYYNSIKWHENIIIWIS